MRCPHCDSWTTVLETREGEHGTNRRQRQCANGHRFYSMEITETIYKGSRSTMKNSLIANTKRAERWKRDQAIARDPRSSAEVARAVGLDRSHVSHIRIKHRALAARVS